MPVNMSSNRTRWAVGVAVLAFLCQVAAIPTTTSTQIPSIINPSIPSLPGCDPSTTWPSGGRCTAPGVLVTFGQTSFVTTSATEAETETKLDTTVAPEQMTTTTASSSAPSMSGIEKIPLQANTTLTTALRPSASDQAVQPTSSSVSAASNIEWSATGRRGGQLRPHYEKWEPGNHDISGATTAHALKRDLSDATSSGGRSLEDKVSPLLNDLATVQDLKRASEEVRTAHANTTNVNRTSSKVSGFDGTSEHITQTEESSIISSLSASSNAFSTSSKTKRKTTITDTITISPVESMKPIASTTLPQTNIQLLVTTSTSTRNAALPQFGQADDGTGLEGLQNLDVEGCTRAVRFGAGDPPLSCFSFDPIEPISPWTATSTASSSQSGEPHESMSLVETSVLQTKAEPSFTESGALLTSQTGHPDESMSLIATSISQTATSFSELVEPNEEPLSGESSQSQGQAQSFLPVGTETMLATPQPESQSVTLDAFGSDTAAVNTLAAPSATMPEPSTSSPISTSYSESSSAPTVSMPGNDATSSAVNSETGPPIIIDSTIITLEVTATISPMPIFPDTESESSNSMAGQTTLPEDEQTGSSLQSDYFVSASQLAYHAAEVVTIMPELLLTVTYTTTICLSSN